MGSTVTLLLGYSDPKVLLLTWAGPRYLLLPAPAGVRSEAALPRDPPQVPLQAAAQPPPIASAPASSPTSGPTMPSHLHTTSMPPPPAPRPLKVQRSDSLLDETPPPPSSRPRPPEVHLDPRTAFRRGGQASRVGTSRVQAPTRAPEAASDGPIADLVIVPQMPTFRASEQGVKAVLGYLRNSQILAARAEKLSDEGVRIDLLPDAFSHLAFTEGQAPPGPPSIAEGTLWFGPKPLALAFGDPTRRTSFRLDLVGCRFPRLADAFLARLQQILYLRPEVIASPHDPARLRATTPTLAAQPIPHFDLQEFDP